MLRGVKASDSLQAINLYNGSLHLSRVTMFGCHYVEAIKLEHVFKNVSINYIHHSSIFTYF